MGISDRGTKAKSITSCDNAFVTNIVLARDPAAKRMFSVRKRSDSNNKSGSSDAPQEALFCAKAKRQRQMFSVAKAKLQLQSAQSERKSTTLYVKSFKFEDGYSPFYIIFQ
ncbi:hypothetical protein ACIQYL_04915 [Lysinibacillus xylanilyticus]|uniref:hypothetical protein n=1 Tax=Lysinibacillus xylanilyticus TaxID=582475 RepID=UPI0038158B92